MNDPYPVRIEPLAKDAVDDDGRVILAAAFGAEAADRLLAQDEKAPALPSVLATLLRHPTLAGPFLAYNSMLLQRATLNPRHRELMILRVAWLTKSHYEWLQHVRLARTCGISDAEIGAIDLGSSHDAWAPFDAALLAAAEELVHEHRISDAVWNRLRAELDERQLIEAVFVVGTYTALAMAFNSFGVPLDADLVAMSETTPLPSEIAS